MAKRKQAGNGLFKEASKRRKAHPRKFKDWKDYVRWASRMDKGKAKGPAKKKTSRKKKRVGATYKPVKVAHCEKVGTVRRKHTRTKKYVEEQLAWALLARDRNTLRAPHIQLTSQIVKLRKELDQFK